MTTKFSAFTSGSAIQVADNFVGLQSGENVKWTFTQWLAFLTGKSITGQVAVITPTPHLSANGATILINGNTAAEVVFTHPVALTVQLADDENGGVNIGAFGTGMATFVGRHAIGSAASPTADTVDTLLVRMVGRGYRATGYSNNIGGFGVYAAGTFTDTSTPTYTSIQTCPTGSTNTQTEVARGQPGGGFSVGDTTYNATDRATGVLAVKTSIVIGTGPTLTATNVPTLDASTNAFTGTLLSLSGGATLPTPTTNASVQIAHGTTSGVAVELNSFNGNGFVVFRRANTSSTAPSAIVSNNQLGNFQFTGWNTSAYAVGASINARSTATTWDGTHNGAFLAFFTTADASTTVTEQLRLQGSGGLSVGNANLATDGGAGVVVATSFTGAGTGLTGTAASLTAGTVTTNANLTGPIASSGNATSITAQTGTGTTFVMQASPTITGSLTLSSAGFITSGSLSAAAWTTNGVRTQMAAASYTDTSSSGTVSTAYTDLFGAGTILASSATTYTNYYGAFFKAPVASTNVTMTNKSALGADSISIGGAAQSTFALAVTGSVSMSSSATVAGLITANQNKTSLSTAGALGFLLVSPGTNFFGMAQNGNNTGFLGYSATQSGAGTAVIQWTDNGPINLIANTAIVQYGAADVASPVAQTIKFQSVVAGNANTAGAPTTIQGSLSNGSGGGDILVKTTLSVAASGTQNSAATALTLKGGTQNVIAAAALTSASASGGVGYSTGAGGTVTQATSKSTGVTLNTTTGQITMNNANLAGQTEVSFTLTNSAIAATDVVLVTIASGATANSYVVGVAATAAGSCVIQVGNVTLATTLGEAVVLNFAVIKGVTS